MIIERVWAMPNKHTFLIKPIKELVDGLVGDGKAWIDPFAGKYSVAEYANDLNPEYSRPFCVDANSLPDMLPENMRYAGVLFDPPYSLTQVARSYKNFGVTGWNKKDPTGGFCSLKTRLAHLLPVGAKAVCCGWNTVGFGKTRGFSLDRVLVVCHGGNRNDTLVTVETKATE